MNRRLRKRQLYSNARLDLLADPVKASAERALKSIDEMLRAFDIEKYGVEVMAVELIGKENIEEMIQSIKASSTEAMTPQEIAKMRKQKQGSS